jgi:hypothetical protein
MANYSGEGRGGAHFHSIEGGRIEPSGDHQHKFSYAGIVIETVAPGGLHSHANAAADGHTWYSGEHAHTVSVDGVDYVTEVAGDHSHDGQGDQTAFDGTHSHAVYVAHLGVTLESMDAGMEVLVRAVDRPLVDVRLAWRGGVSSARVRLQTRGGWLGWEVQTDRVLRPVLAEEQAALARHCAHVDFERPLAAKLLRAADQPPPAGGDEVLVVTTRGDWGESGDGVVEFFIDPGAGEWSGAWRFEQGELCRHRDGYVPRVLERSKALRSSLPSTVLEGVPERLRWWGGVAREPSEALALAPLKWSDPEGFTPGGASAMLDAEAYHDELVHVAMALVGRSAAKIHLGSPEDLDGDADVTLSFVSGVERARESASWNGVVTVVELADPAHLTQLADVTGFWVGVSTWREGLRRFLVPGFRHLGWASNLPGFRSSPVQQSVQAPLQAEPVLRAVKRSDNLGAAQVCRNRAGTTVYRFGGVVQRPGLVDSYNTFFTTEQVERTARDFLAHKQNIHLEHGPSLSALMKPTQSFIAYAAGMVGGVEVQPGDWYAEAETTDPALGDFLLRYKLGWSIGGFEINGTPEARSASDPLFRGTRGNGDGEPRHGALRQGHGGDPLGRAGAPAPAAALPPNGGGPVGEVGGRSAGGGDAAGAAGPAAGPAGSAPVADGSAAP